MGDWILIVDDPLVLELVESNLRGRGYEIITAEDGQDGIRKFHETRPDLVILDVAMPKLDGYQVCQRICEVSDTPIIMLTAKGHYEEEIIKGLDMGADDYVAKFYHDDYLHIDLSARVVTCNNQPVKLTPTEYKLLSFLVKNKGRWLEFRQILENVWGFEYIDDIDYLRVYIWHLRRKLEPDAKNPIYLLNELNVGYKFELQI